MVFCVRADGFCVALHDGDSAVDVTFVQHYKSLAVA